MIQEKPNAATGKPQFVEYPITLAHPSFTPSKPVPVPGSQVYDHQGTVVRQDYRGTPERFPPVTAGNESEEEYYRAQGYERAGKMDPSAWVRAHADAPPADYVPQKYPLWRDGVLIASAADDPDATDADFNEVAAPERAPPVVEATEAQNLRAQMDEMNRTMAAMAEQMRAAKEETATLKAERDTLAASESGAVDDAPILSEPVKRPPGRPRKAD